MTLPSEEKWALARTKKLLRACLHKSIWEEEFPEVPWKRRLPFIRKEAGSCLRHYPMQYRIDKLYKDEKE